MKVTVWLLSMASPEGDAQADWLREQLYDARRYPLPIEGLRPLWVWWRLRRPNRPALPGPTEEGPPIEAACQTLDRMLGPNYNCVSVTHTGRASLEGAARGVGAGERVILLPLAPWVTGGAEVTVVSDAMQILQECRARVAVAKGVGDHQGVVEAMAEAVRASVIDVGEDYGVLFCAQTWGAKDPIGMLDVPRRVAALKKHLGLEKPSILGFAAPPGLNRGPAPTVQDGASYLKDKGVSQLVVVPIAIPDLRHGWLTPMIEQGGVDRVSWTPEIVDRPTHLRALAEAVVQTQKEAGWHA